MSNRMVVMLDGERIYDGTPMSISDLDDVCDDVSYLYAGEDVRKKLLIINEVNHGEEPKN